MIPRGGAPGGEDGTLKYAMDQPERRLILPRQRAEAGLDAPSRFRGGPAPLWWRRASRRNHSRPDSCSGEPAGCWRNLERTRIIPSGPMAQMHIRKVFDGGVYT